MHCELRNDSSENTSKDRYRRQIVPQRDYCAPVGVRSAAMSVWVCLSVCLSARTSQETSQNFT